MRKIMGSKPLETHLITAGLKLNRTVVALTCLLVMLGATYGQKVNPRQPETEKPPKQESGKEKSQLPDRPIEIVNVINEANSAPPEFAADILIRLAQSSKISDVAWKREIITDAFRLASKSDQKLKRTYFGTVMDTREGYLGLALAQNLDTLSLQLRAVTAMLAVDKARAREMFSEISPDLKIPPLTCSDALVPDVSDFYAVMKRVADETLGSDEAREGAALWFVQPYVQAINSPAQVAPVAKAIDGLKLPADQFAIVLRSFTESLKRISGDYRTFSSTALRDSLTQSFVDLANQCDRLNVPKQELLQAVRGYLLRGFGSTQCADRSVSQSKPLPGFIVGLNRDLLKGAPVSFEDIQPTIIGESPQTIAFWESSRSKDILNRLRRLRFRSDGKARTDDEKTSPEWQQQLSDFLTDLDTWSVADEKSDVDYFHEKAITYRVLSDILPSGLMRDRIWRNNASFLADGYLPHNRIEWFMHASHFLDRVKGLKGKDRADLITIFSSSRNNVLRSYAYLNDVVRD